MAKKKDFIDDIEAIDDKIMIQSELDLFETKQKNYITRYPTYYEIHNYSENRNTEFEKYLSVWDKIKFDYTYGAYLIDEVNDTMRVPGGLSIDDITKYLPMYTSLEDKRKHYKQFTTINRHIRLKFPPRDEIQRKAIEFLMDDMNMPDGTQKLLSLNTGDGKTYCAVNYVSASSRIPMIFVSKNNLAEQWVERIIDYTDGTRLEEVYHIAGKASINRLLKMNSRDLRKYKFFIANHKTIGNYAGDDLDKLNNLFDHLSISVKIFDEAHENYESMNKIDMLTKCPSIYLTATPGRSNYLEDRVYKILMYNMRRFTSTSRRIRKEHLRDKYHRVIICRYDTKPTEEFMAKFKKASAKRGFNVNAYVDYILEQKFDLTYNKLKIILTRLVFTFLSDGKPDVPVKKTVLLTKRIEMIEQLYETILADPQFDNDKISVGRFHSGVSQEEKDDVLANANLIITTDASMGTGIDIPDLEVIISTIPTSSAVKTEQMLGRLRDLGEDREVIFFDLVDIGFEESRNQLARRTNTVYKRKAKRIQEVKFY